MANISDFKAQLIGGGARPNQFSVELTFPAYVVGGPAVGLQSQFLCKAAQLPASNIENMPIQYRGRAVNFAGERVFQPWTVAIYNDSQTNGRTNPRDYQVDLRVHQLDRNGAIVKSYKFHDAYPTTIGAITVDYDTVNTMEIFDVEFTYNYWTSDTSTDGSNFGVKVAVNTPIGTFPINI